MSEYWHQFRYWLASRIVGFNIEIEVDAAYMAGVEWGKVARFMENKDASEV